MVDAGLPPMSEAKKARTATRISDVVSNGLCIGCGLCEAVTDRRIRMVMTEKGSLRPSQVDAFTQAEEATLLSACPGVAVESRFTRTPENDLVWGAFSSMRYAWAGDPELRFRAATGGVLSALGVHLLKTGAVRFILHVGADPEHPMRSRWVLSETPQDVIANSGSRYGPVAPLAGLMQALERNEPFAIIAKPCDLSAVHRFARTDERVDRLCKLRLTLVCGGQSRLEKSQDFLEEHGVAEEDVTLFRYRGFGNPGRTRVETSNGQAFEKSYQELWENEAGWKLETRCKICPDALGEAADLAAADVWPQANPIGEDAGFNGIIVRSKAGTELVAAAFEAGDLVLGDEISPRQFDDFQPHQLRKKHALSARFAGLAAAGNPVLAAPGLRLEELGCQIDEQSRQAEAEGAARRARQGRFAEDI